MAAFRREPSILTRLMWSLTMVVLFTSLSVVIIYDLLETRRAESETTRRVEECSANLAKGLEVPVWSYDLDAIKGLVDAFAVDENVAGIVVSEPSGATMASFQRTLAGRAVTSNRPISYDGYNVGTVSVSLSPAGYEAANSRNFQASLILVLLVSLAVLGAGRLMLNYYFRTPMEQLQCIVSDCAAGKYDVPDKAPAFEFREFTRVLGDMAGRIKKQITELRATRDALERSEKRFNLALDAADDALWDWDIPGGNMFFSRRFYTMLGYERGEFSADIESWRKLIHPEDAPLVDEELEHHFNTGARFAPRFRMRTGAGEWRWIKGKGRVVEHDGKGRPLRMVGIHTDITGQIRAEDELRRMQGFLSDVLDSMPSFLAGVDSEGRITHWSLGAIKATGIPPEQAEGRHLGAVYPDLAGEIEKIKNAVVNRTPLVETRKAFSTDGEIRFLDMGIYPLAGDGLEGAVVRLDDVTERVRIDEVLMQSEKMLSVGGLAAGMAHEINNPLAGILGTVQVLKNRLFTDMKRNVLAADECGIDLSACREYLRMRGVGDMLSGMEESGERAARIVSNMLTFSRKSNQQFSMHSLDSLLDETMELASSDYDLKKGYDFRRINVVREYEPGVPPVWCEGGEIQQVFLNLLRNGAEAMAEKEYDGEEPAFVLRVLLEDTVVRVEIKDNGPGMEEAVRKRVFEPFFTSKGPGRGTGLGLSVSYFIITDQHKGNMEVRSTPGRGTRFIIKMPVASAVQAEFGAGTGAGPEIG